MASTRTGAALAAAGLLALTAAASTAVIVGVTSTSPIFSNAPEHSVTVNGSHVAGSVDGCLDVKVSDAYEMPRYMPVLVRPCGTSEGDWQVVPGTGYTGLDAGQ